MAQRRRNIELTQVTEWENGKAARVEDCLAAEEPLEMRAGRYSLGVTLRTPGDDEDLVAGFLFTEGILSRREDLVALRMPDETARNRNLVRVTLDPSVRLSANNATRRFSAGSACGVCGKASITQLRRRGLRRPEAASLFDPEILCVSCRLDCALRRLSLAEPAGCTRRRFSPRAASCSSCAKTSAGTTPWTKLSAGLSSTAAFRSAVKYSWSAAVVASRSCKKRLPRAFRCWHRFPRRRVSRYNWRANWD